MSDVAKSYIPSIDLKQCPFAQIAVTTAAAASYFSHWNAATPAQVQAKEPGVCILVVLLKESNNCIHADLLLTCLF